MKNWKKFGKIKLGKKYRTFKIFRFDMDIDYTRRKATKEIRGSRVEIRERLHEDRIIRVK